ncbi:alpha-D-ribose 1-methylphosphonate 5-triphosphate diphosphatase [Telmatospirillum siberiense]|uniref:Phosphonate metabolism protein PhnM n=1 Tax=Telmatospirillum siberiense TaxID=382514 RepID=A0A2N3Q163_9PROT|nr:alpha-D-ribose 1-methylphosphonate 5-triphosphate diphosphatase [Telmatospirillum siberiense]PKU26394.1 phosphonate metabolism protein PhnM [Telmatospirillum siberiense]
MNSEIILTNARIVTETEEFPGTIQVRDGLIADIASGKSHIAGAVDCREDHLLPGLIELHTDNLEKHVTPRPKVRWNATSAVMAHDAQMAAAGITTVFDAISCGDIIDGSERLANLNAMVEGVVKAQASGHLRSEHRLHLRCEVSSANIVSLFESFADNPLVGIVSLMDHTPGQRQFVHEDKYMEYYMGKYHFTAAEMAAFTRRQRENSARYSADHRLRIAAASRDRGLTLASHDDATPDHVEEALALGIDFSEFPTTVEAARAAHAAGIRVLMGAPNVVRGGSHSGNVAAGDLAKAGVLDVLSSDYVPFSLMHAAFLLSRDGIGLDLPAAVATVSSVPAAVAGLDDRGAIAVGRRADLVRVHDTGEVPVIRTVWRGGARIA